MTDDVVPGCVVHLCCQHQSTVTIALASCLPTFERSQEGIQHIAIAGASYLSISDRDGVARCALTAGTAHLALASAHIVESTH